jgi:hypothetical protein
MEAWAKRRLAELKEAAPAKHEKKVPFAKVPLPLAAEAAAATGGLRLFVWLWLLHRSWQRQTRAVVVPNTALRQYGISREVKRRALNDLAAAGIISVEYRPYKNPMVTLLSVDG